MQGKKGFTLVEVLVVVALTGIMISSFYFFQDGIQVFSNYFQNEAKLRRNVRSLRWQLENDILHAKKIYINYDSGEADGIDEIEPGEINNKIDSFAMSKDVEGLLLEFKENFTKENSFYWFRDNSLAYYEDVDYTSFTDNQDPDRIYCEKLISDAEFNYTLKENGVTEFVGNVNASFIVETKNRLFEINDEYRNRN